MAAQGGSTTSQLVVQVKLDIVFLTNLVTDLAWLWATSRLAGVRPRTWRLPMAATVGAALAVWAYFPGGRWLTTLPGILIGSLLFVALAFLPCPPSHLVRTVGYLFISGGAMAGIALLIDRRGAGLLGGGAGTRVPGNLVAAGLLLCLVGGRYLWESARERSRMARGLYAVEIQIGGSQVVIAALLDTGNRLRDPISGLPVVVVEAKALGAVLPLPLMRAVSAGWEALEALPTPLASRCRLVPFRAVGQPAGVLLAFAPDRLALRAPGRKAWHQVRGLIGLAAEPLHPDQSYQALLSPDLVERAAQVS